MGKQSLIRFTKINFAVFLLFFISCDDDVSKIATIPSTETFENTKSINLKVNRFDNQVYNYIHTLDPNAIVDTIESEYPVFGKDYMGRILGLSSPYYSPAKNRSHQVAFFSDTTVHSLFEEIHNYKGLDQELDKLGKYLAHYQHYFPKSTIPYLILMNGGFSYQTINYGDTLLIGADLFLGSDFNYPPSIPMFLRNTYAPAYLIPKTLRALLEKEAPALTSYRFIDLIIANGIKMYALEQMLPNFPVSAVTNYTEENYIWAQTFERDIWQTFQKDKLLFSTEYEKFKKNIEPSPNAPGLPIEAPGELGNYIGWQIVRKYMETHPQTTLPQLLRMTDGNLILQQSKYKP